MSEKEISNKRDASAVMLICLLVLQGIAVYYYGIRAAVVGIISVFTCFAVNLLCLKIRSTKNYSFLPAVTMGLELSVMMSAAVPYYVVILAGIFGIGLIRHAFGGEENEIFSPACTGYLFAEICFPAILSYPKVFSDTPVIGESTEGLFESLTSAMIKGSAGISGFELSAGRFSSPMGLGSAALICVIAVFLFAKRISSWETFLSMTVLYGGISFIAGGIHDLKYNLLLGMYIYCGVFFICRKVPEKTINKIIYGLIAGLLVSLFRYAGNAENPAVYAAVLSAPAGIILTDAENSPKHSRGERFARK